MQFGEEGRSSTKEGNGEEQKENCINEESEVEKPPKTNSQLKWMTMSNKCGTRRTNSP